MPSFSTSLSGLDASSVALSVISNNLANMNTIGYKTTRANFQDLFYQQIGNSGNGNPEQVGVGVTVGSVASLFTQGSIQSTGVSTDVAVQGNGFFVVNKSGTQAFSRAGNFSVGPTGELTTQDGGLVLGYPATNGVISTNQTVSPITITPGLTSPPKSTTEIQLTMNLDSNAAAPVSAGSQQTGSGIAAATILKTGGVLTISDGTNTSTYTTVSGDTLNEVAAGISNANFTATVSGNSLIINAKSGTPITFTANTLTDAAASTQSETFAASATPVAAGSYSTSVAVYDALGGSHILSFNFTKTAVNTWNYAITIPAADVGQTGNPVTVNSGTLQFSGSGQLISPTANVTNIQINGLADGASNLAFAWNLYPATGGGLLTQESAPSAASSTQQDGYSSGSLQSFSIGSDGTVSGVFSNNQTLALGQIALASFANEQGLQRNGSNEYLASLASGQPNIGAPNTGGLGTLVGGALEQSNVDIATEFSQLILAQRDYQANAQALTTLDKVTQYAFNMMQNG